MLEQKIDQDKVLLVVHNDPVMLDKATVKGYTAQELLEKCYKSPSYVESKITPDKVSAIKINGNQIGNLNTVVGEDTVRVTMYISTVPKG